jgi:hypothetical protein
LDCLQILWTNNGLTGYRPRQVDACAHRCAMSDLVIVFRGLWLL